MGVHPRSVSEFIFFTSELRNPAMATQHGSFLRGRRRGAVGALSVTGGSATSDEPAWVSPVAGLL